MSVWNRFLQLLADVVAGIATNAAQVKAARTDINTLLKESRTMSQSLEDLKGTQQQLVAVIQSLSASQTEIGNNQREITNSLLQLGLAQQSLAQDSARLSADIQVLSDSNSKNAENLGDIARDIAAIAARLDGVGEGGISADDAKALSTEFGKVGTALQSASDDLKTTAKGLGESSQNLNTVAKGAGDQATSLRSTADALQDSTDKVEAGVTELDNAANALDKLAIGPAPAPALSLTSMTPDHITTEVGVGQVINLEGTGFTAASVVKVGSAGDPVETTLNSEASITFELPAQFRAQPAVIDVWVENAKPAGDPDLSNTLHLFVERAPENIKPGSFS